MLTKTAEEYRAEAAAHEQEARDSFERCDTDGFLSQWAGGLSAQRARLAAQLAEQGGEADFKRLKLVTLAGEDTDARRVETRYGTKWRLDATDEWRAYRPAREGTLAKHGYREEYEFERAPARADFWSPPGALGLSGATSVRVLVLRDDVRKGLQSQWDFDGWDA